MSERTQREQAIASWTAMGEALVLRDMCEADRILYERAQAMTVDLVKLYMSRSMPFVVGDARDEWLAKKLRQVRDRYLVPLRI